MLIFIYYIYLLNIDAGSRLNVSGNSLKSHGENMLSITKVPILEWASDVALVSCFGAMNFQEPLALIHQCGQTRGNGLKGNLSVSSISIFCCKARNRIFPNKSRSILTSIILFLFNNLKLTPSLAKLCIFCSIFYLHFQ